MTLNTRHHIFAHFPWHGGSFRLKAKEFTHSFDIHCRQQPYSFTTWHESRKLPKTGCYSAFLDMTPHGHLRTPTKWEKNLRRKRWKLPKIPKLRNWACLFSMSWSTPIRKRTRLKTYRVTLWPKSCCCLTAKVTVWLDVTVRLRFVVVSSDKDK